MRVTGKGALLYIGGAMLLVWLFGKKAEPVQLPLSSASGSPDPRLLLLPPAV